jgi:tetratricopeptide (TPR) repeat protein
MGLFGIKKRIKFVPNFKKSDYENWLTFAERGGSTKEWEQLKTKKHWVFPESEIGRFMRYEDEVGKVADEYYSQMQKIQNEWSVLYNAKAYTGILADNFEKECIANIANYKEMRRIDKKYRQKTATNVPAFKRLAMLYEKQGRFEDAVEVCKQAYSIGMDERRRMARMIKKAGRTPTKKEQSILEKE